LTDSAIFFERFDFVKKILAIITTFVILFTGCHNFSAHDVFSPESNPYADLSLKCIGWGFRRTENGPEFTKEQIHIMKKYSCIFKENTEEKTIYLTFDEGYENGYTSVILDTLREKDVKAAFFVTGPYVKENPELIKRMAEEGHIIGNHTVNHPSLPTINDINILKNELYGLDRLIYDICGEKTTFLRPPKGEYSEYILAVTKDLGYTNVFWSQAYVDWDNKVSSTEAFEKITKNIHPGCVLLLHAVSKGNAEALKDVIEYARKEGYTFKPLTEYKN